ncbi:MAG: hypothetical protein ACJARX_000677 [Psychroserpens sp.]|jgi:hypothetical protein
MRTPNFSAVGSLFGLLVRGTIQYHLAQHRLNWCGHYLL